MVADSATQPRMPSVGRSGLLVWMPAARPGQSVSRWSAGSSCGAALESMRPAENFPVPRPFFHSIPSALPLLPRTRLLSHACTDAASQLPCRIPFLLRCVLRFLPCNVMLLPSTEGFHACMHASALETPGDSESSRFVIAAQGGRGGRAGWLGGWVRCNCAPAMP